MASVAERLGALLRSEADGVRGDFELEFARQAGVPVRLLRRLLRGQEPAHQLDLGTVDQILAAIGRPDLAHLEPEDGGFSDLFEAGAQLALDLGRAA